MSSPFWRAVPDGIEINVRATPKGGRDSIDGVMTDAAGAQWLSVRVTAPPDGGKANQAIAKILAFHFAARLRDVVLVSGATARLKRLKILGDSDHLGSIAVKFGEE